MHQILKHCSQTDTASCASGRCIAKLSGRAEGSPAQSALTASPSCLKTSWLLLGLTSGVGKLGLLSPRGASATSATTCEHQCPFACLLEHDSLCCHPSQATVTGMTHCSNRHNRCSSRDWCYMLTGRCALHIHRYMVVCGQQTVSSFTCRLAILPNSCHKGMLRFST